MKIAYFTLDAHHLTAAEITCGDHAPCTFLQVDKKADLDVLTDRCVLLRDVVEAPDQETHSWCGLLELPIDGGSALRRPRSGTQ